MLTQDRPPCFAPSFRSTLNEAVKNYPKVIAITHVPPFREAAWYEGRPSDDNWLPNFACKAVGYVMLEVMDPNPSCKLTVLCGHTHSGGKFDPLPKVEVLTGTARYSEPELQQIFEIE